jgi:hypothetical protein
MAMAAMLPGSACGTRYRAKYSCRSSRPQASPPAGVVRRGRGVATPTSRKMPSSTRLWPYLGHKQRHPVLHQQHALFPSELWWLSPVAGVLEPAGEKLPLASVERSEVRREKLIFSIA